MVKGSEDILNVGSSVLDMNQVIYGIYTKVPSQLVCLRPLARHLIGQTEEDLCV